MSNMKNVLAVLVIALAAAACDHVSPTGPVSMLSAVNLPAVYAADGVPTPRPRPTLPNEAPTRIPPRPQATATPACPSIVTLHWNSHVQGQEVAGITSLQCAVPTNDLRSCLSGVRYAANGNVIGTAGPRSFDYNWNVTPSGQFGSIVLACVALDLAGHEYSLPAYVTVNREYPPD